MAVNGKNYGSVYQETFGTTSPVSGSAPTDPTDGQPMDGLSAIQPVVSAAVSVLLSGAGTLQAYILDPSLVPQAKALQASASDATTITATGDLLASGYVVGMTLKGSKSGTLGVITSIGGGGNTVATCSGGVTGSVMVGEQLNGTDPGRWMRFPDADYTVANTTRDQPFLPFSLLTPRKGRIKWVPNSVTFGGGGSGGIQVTQLGQVAGAGGLHDAGWWGG